MGVMSFVFYSTFVASIWLSASLHEVMNIREYTRGRKSVASPSNLKLVSSNGNNNTVERLTQRMARKTPTRKLACVS